MSTGWIVIGVVVILVLFALGAYNRLVALSQRVGQAFADIDVQLKQRHDLIPNLVETVKGYAAHERGRLIALSEAYPDLKANANFQQLAGELSDLENKNRRQPPLLQQRGSGIQH